MDALGNSIASADMLKRFIHSEIRATDNKISNPEEAAEAEDEKKKAMSAIDQTVSLVNCTLARLRSIRKPRPGRAEPVHISSTTHLNPGRTIKVSTALEVNKFSDAGDRRGTLQSSAQSLLQLVSADGLEKPKKTLEEMATSIEPIVDNFDSVLRKPYLDHFSATLSTVPLVGLKNNQIMYLATKPDGSKLKDVWAYFGALPAGITAADTSKIHFFPWKGDLCISVGTGVWKKRKRSKGDPALSKAVGDWPRMYYDEWEKIGDNAFPTADYRSVIPFAEIQPDGEVAQFKLLILNHDGIIQLLDKDDIYASNTWTSVSYSKGGSGPANPPNWSRMAYWNNTVVALDHQNNTWNLNVKFDARTYTINDKAAIGTTMEFTATDIGPVAARPDGYLYRRSVREPPSDGSDPTLQWSQWVRQDGVTNLGVASPGVILDLLVLTRSLKSRYLETQTVLYPVVNKISAFTVTHNVFLKNLMEAAKKYADSTETEKKEQAIKEGKGFVAHAKIWGKLMNTSIANTKDAVNAMTRQLRGVKDDLEPQLVLLRDQLTGLQNTLKIQKENLDTLRAAFWGAVAATLLGIALGVILVATGVSAWWLVAAGALFVGGIVATVALSVKMADLAGEISKTQSQINVTNTAIAELSSVVDNFTNLEDLYGTLNEFWGRMFNDSNSINTTDSVIEEYGDDILQGTADMEASYDMTEKIGRAATLYLDTLNKQGVHIPTKAAEDESRMAKLVSVPSTLYLDVTFYDTVAKAGAALAGGHAGKYEELMETAYAMEARKAASIQLDEIRTSVWYDVPKVSIAAQVFNRGPLRAVSIASISWVLAGVSAQLYDSADMENCIKSAAPVVVGMLHKTNDMCHLVRNLLKRYQEAGGDRQKIDQLRETLLKKAIEECEKAQVYSARANNAFVDVNNAAVDYQINLERQVNVLDGDASSARASAAERMRDIYVPWYVYLGGWRAIDLYTKEKKNEIQSDLNTKLRRINNAIAELKGLRLSGIEINGHAATWIKMVRTVSGCLGGVYNVLTEIWGLVMDDPTLYEACQEVEWAKVQENTTEVLRILAAKGVDINPPEATENSLLTARTVYGAPQVIMAPKPGTGDVVKALLAPQGMDSTMTNQANQAKNFFAKMDKLLRSPYLSAIVGYWDNAQTEKTSLLDVVNRLRRQYVNMMANEYPAIENLYTSSLLQEKRAKFVLNDKLSLEIFVRSSLRSARASQQAAQAATAKFRAASADYTVVLKQIRINLEEIEKKLEEIDKNIDDLEKKQRDMIISLIADVVALAFASAALLIGIGFLGPVATALHTAAIIGLGAAATAASIKGVIDSLNLADIVKLITALKSAKRDLESTHKSLAHVQPVFKEVVSAAEGMEALTITMADGLQNLMNDLEMLKLIHLSKDDVRAIGESWTEVKDASLAWLDIINGQGIVPATF